ncbi:hypothetical protein Cni_G11870 [Canna indica]|uniref:Photosystem I assembly factor PSA3, chloroplastic n=1 Tax=Canna indica TaxID=4628 RepID=A0AAQ3QC52_9LILI|nr:hypothetical protein Cni_G11870 [Canna indica]
MVSIGIATLPPSPHLFSSLLPPKPFTLLLPLRRRGFFARDAGAARSIVVGYMERKPNSISGVANKLIGALPVVGLLARILSDEGGVGDDLIDFAEFRRLVSKKCSVTDSSAFYEFKNRRGRAGDPFYVLLCCWLAAVGAGLLKSEEILEGVARLRISNDIEFEEETFFAKMTTARERRAKMKGAVPEIPMVVRVEKALEAIYICSFGNDPIEEEDVRLLGIMLNVVFPSVGKPEIDRLVTSMAEQISTGQRTNYPEPKSLSKEAVERQMKDLEFLQQNKENSS